MYNHPNNACYRAYLFGPFRLVCAHRHIEAADWRRNKAKSLLKWFLLNQNQHHSADQLCALFWPAVPHEKAAHNLHVTIHSLRHLLEPDLLQGQESKYLRRNRQRMYWLELDDTWWVDIREVQQLYCQAQNAERCGEDAHAYALYRKIILCYRQDFLPEDIYEEVFNPFRYQYDYLHTQVLERLIHLSLHLGYHEETLLHTQLLLALDPYHETAVFACANAYYHQGQLLKAMSTLDEFYALLQQEMGTEPGQEIGELRRQFAELSL